MVAVSSLVLSVSGDSESEPVPEIGLRPGKRSASNTLEMISALSEREPDVAWDILLASEDIDLKPLFRNETLAAVEVELFEEQSARYHHIKSKEPLTLEKLRGMPPRLRTDDIEWDYDIVPANDHETICGDDICRCATLRNFRSPEIELSCLTDKLAERFGCPKRDKLRLVALQARLWEFIEEHGGRKKLAKHCQAVAVPGYYGEELGSTYFTRKWSRELVNRVRQVMELPAEAVQIIAPSLQKTVEIAIPQDTERGPYRPPSSVTIIMNALEQKFPKASFGFEGDERHFYDLSYGRPFPLKATPGVRKWLEGEAETRPPTITFAALAVNPGQVFQEVNRVLDNYLAPNEFQI